MAAVYATKPALQLLAKDPGARPHPEHSPRERLELLIAGWQGVGLPVVENLQVVLDPTQEDVVVAEVVEHLLRQQRAVRQSCKPVERVAGQELRMR